MHFHDHSMHKSPLPGVREVILIILLIEATIPMALLRVVYAFFAAYSFVKYYSACCLKNSANVFWTNSCHALKINLNHRNQTDVSRLKDCSKNPFTFTHFCHHTAIHYFNNWFICFDLAYFLYNKEFFVFCKIFSTTHIARVIIKLIARATFFLEVHVRQVGKSRDEYEMQTMQRCLHPGPKIFLTCI